MDEPRFVLGGLPGSEERKRTKIQSGWLLSSEERKEPNFVRPFRFGVSGGLPKNGGTKIRKFGWASEVTPKILWLSGDFRRMEKTKFRSVSEE
ncbi:unnamed protein product [Rhizophagus irregularis]|nr:unnamed protein product [Rhizophagus irregularis]